MQFPPVPPPLPESISVRAYIAGEPEQERKLILTVATTATDSNSSLAKIYKYML